MLCRFTIDALVWLPAKVLAHLLRPVAGMAESIADNADQALADYYKEHVL